MSLPFSELQCLHPKNRYDAGGDGAGQGRDRLLDPSWGLDEVESSSEVSQKDKDHYSILTHIYGI